MKIKLKPTFQSEGKKKQHRRKGKINSAHNSKVMKSCNEDLIQNNNIKLQLNVRENKRNRHGQKLK